MKYFIVALAVCVAAVAAAPLDDYVNKPDPTYSWHNHTTIKGSNYMVYNVFLTSQVHQRPQWSESRDSKKKKKKKVFSSVISGHRRSPALRSGACTLLYK